MTELNYHYENGGNPLAGKAILLNGPMGSGKDYAADILAESLGCYKHEFKSTIFNIALAITGLSRKDFFTLYNDRDIKENPNPKFFGMSPREMMIWISEDVCKPKFGEQYFGKPAAYGVDLEVGAVFPDSGFSEEVYPIAERIGADNVYVVRFTRNGEKFNEKDSRGFLQEKDCPTGVKFINLTNDGCINDFVNTISDWVINN